MVAPKGATIRKGIVMVAPRSSGFSQSIGEVEGFGGFLGVGKPLNLPRSEGEPPKGRGVPTPLGIPPRFEGAKVSFPLKASPRKSGARVPTRSGDSLRSALRSTFVLFEKQAIVHSKVACPPLQVGGLMERKL
ncbi:hypothetical protein RRG08_015273 [Elysia crispata]|uniref:Uncharacterized protein n=1 Tax=Elysia crispata TaxID=231223 RepID=A0AAE1AUA8_9GAST|nr:hypothetical protein RRG08_015273 [Elysia crispata]